MNRREFLASAATLGLTSVSFAGADASARAPKRPSGRLLLRAGVFSDLHITNEPSIAIVEKALRHYRDADVDAVICTGDMADHGLESEMALFEKAWGRVFPDNRGKSGRPIARVFITGNHDVGITGNKTDAKNVQHHATFFGEPLVPVFAKTVKGIPFVCENWGGGKAARAYVKAHAAELKKAPIFFFLQHSHHRGTIPYAWVTDNGETTKLLNDFPNCMSLTGHSHRPIVDGRALWQGGFTSLNCGCLRYTSLNGGRENAKTFGVVDPKTSQMMPLQTYNDGQDGFVMEVYDDGLVFQRRDFKYGLSLGDDFIVPWPIARASASIETRAAAEPAPAFTPGARVTVAHRTGVTRKGEKCEQVFVDFPNCRRKDGSPSRAYDFEVSLETRDFDVVRPVSVKRVYSPGFYRGEAADADTVSCAFGLEEVPKGFAINDGPKRTTLEYRFVVRPVNTFGRKGQPLTTAWIPCA